MADESERAAEATLQWLRESWREYRFYMERDVVWTFQTQIAGLLDDAGSELRVFNDYPVRPGKRRALSGDIALVNPAGGLELVIEFKYEPAHSRKDIPKTKFPVVLWGAEGVGKDVARIRDFVAAGDCTAAWAIFIDEGRAFRHRPAHPGSFWVDWDAGPSVLLARAPDVYGPGCSDVRTGFAC